MRRRKANHFAVARRGGCFLTSRWQDAATLLTSRGRRFRKKREFRFSRGESGGYGKVLLGPARRARRSCSSVSWKRGPPMPWQSSPPRPFFPRSPRRPKTLLLEELEPRQVPAVGAELVAD